MHTDWKKENKVEGKPYFRTPTISPDGQYVAFVYAGDIWQVSIHGGTAERLTAHYAGHHCPHYSPDGTMLAFSSSRTGNGDIYVLPLSGGEVRRVTYHGSSCFVDDWSPDGQHIYFTSRRDQQGEAIYRVSLVGNTPMLIFAEPYETLAYAQLSPDGYTLAFNTIYNPWWRCGPDQYAPNMIWLMKQDTKQRETHQQNTYPLIDSASSSFHAFGLGRWPLWKPDGTGLYFVSDQDGVENIWYRSLEGGEAQQITHFANGRLLWPSIARKVEMLIFEHDWHLWLLDVASGEAAPIAIHVRSDTKITPVRVESWNRNFSELHVSPDGKKIAFVAHGQIFADFSDKETEKELRQGPAFPVTHTHAREGQIAWMPDSSGLIYISDRHGETELYRYDFRTRTETRLTNDLSPKWAPCCSPDGNFVAYVRGFDAIYLLHLQSGESHPFTQGNFVRSMSLAWSPDSRWLAYLSHDDHFFSNAYVQRIDETIPHQITFLSNILGFGLIWSPDGRFLIFTSGQYHMESQIVRVDLRPVNPFLREVEFEKLFKDDQRNAKDEAAKSKEEPKEGVQQSEEGKPVEQKPEQEEQGEHDHPVEQDEEQKNQAKNDEKKTDPVEIVFEGIERRMYFLTPIQMDAEACDISHDSRNLLFVAHVAGKMNIWTLPLDEPRQDQAPQQLTASTSSKRWVQFAPNGKTFFYLDDGQITIRKFPTGRDPVVLVTRCDITVDFEQEKRQVFGEAWRWLRDMFYDPTFRGQDWNAIREHFAPLAMGAQTTHELSLILNLMVGELRTSHLGASSHGGGKNHDGYTGLFFDREAYAKQGVFRIIGMVPDSPVALLDAPPHVGEYLVAVGDVPLTPQTSLDQLLQRTVGRRVLLRFAPTPDSQNSRTVAIRPVDASTYARLRYRAWVAKNESFVHKISGGRLGYVHVEEMSYQAYQQFLVDLDVETYHKEGIVLDIRYNYGGYIATFILDVLTRRSVVLSGFRDRLSTDAYHHSGNRALNKPTVLVTNEHSASNAEIFTEIYRRLGLGKVVGKPTAGAVIGTLDKYLLNGLRFRLPLISISTPEGENLEGIGRAVDLEVSQPLGAWDQGHDYQLEAAVTTLLYSL